MILWLNPCLQMLWLKHLMSQIAPQSMLEKKIRSKSLTKTLSWLARGASGLWMFAPNKTSLLLLLLTGKLETLTVDRVHQGKLETLTVDQASIQVT